ncbi:hypothetical protein [Salinigranum halophilum]|uniref:hypothetical protein n=1 Tax=Salinigranum halophilum TaxID=2565931 RepID=UPI0010A819A5|nr:hypothetical protein [Salinigranum halophilum]
MDAVVEAIQREIHGELVGSGPKTVQCDLRSDHGLNRLIDPAAPVQYEVIRVVDIPIIERTVLPSKTWVPDLLRCPDCERSSLAEPTKGYDEALVELRLSDSGDGYTIDATDLRVLEYSPATDGVHQPHVPEWILRLAQQQVDPGLYRVSRLQTATEDLHRVGEHDRAEQISELLEIARGLTHARE